MQLKSLHILWWFIPCLLLLLACSKDDEPIVDPQPDPDPYQVPSPPAKGSVADRTVLIYIGGDSNLGRDGFASNDLQEMEEAIRTMEKNLYSHNNLLVFYDQYASAEHPKLFRLVKKGEVKTSDTNPEQKELVVSTEQELVMEFSKEVSSTDPTVIKEVMDKAFGDYPAKSYGFLYWSHGEGWLPSKSVTMAIRSTSPLRWIGIDTNSETSGDTGKTGIPELAGVLKQAPNKLDFLMFDACFMMSVEVAYELRDCANYIIASPTETPGPGAPYTEVVPAMFASSQAAVRIAEAYYKYYGDKFNPDVTNTNANWTGGVSMGVMDCTKLNQLASVTKANLLTSSDASALRSAVFDYDKRTSGHVGYYDMEQLMERVLAPAGFDAWKKAYQDALIYWKTTSKNYSSTAGVKLFSMEGTTGVSHFIPSGTTAVRDTEYRSTAWYKDAGLSQLGW